MSRDQIADLKDDLSGQIKELGLVKADVYDKHAKQAANMGTTVFDLLPVSYTHLTLPTKA